jgi:predicted dehydrogenase
MGDLMRARVAILGCGAVTNALYLGAMREIVDVAELVGAADLNAENTAAVQREFPKAKVFRDYREMLKELRPDVALVPLPHFLHKAASVEAMRMGVDVFCEKPMAMNSSECDEIEAAVRASGRIFAVNMLRRMFPSTREIKRMIDARMLGEPRGFEISEGAPYGWPAKSFSFFDRKLAGGGVLIDSGVHTLDLLQWWLGGVEVKEFYDDAEPCGVECDCAAELRAGRAEGTLRMSRSVELENVYRLEFERGWIEWDHDDSTRLRFSAGGGLVRAEVECDARWKSGGRYVYALTSVLRSFLLARETREMAGDLVTASEARKSVDAITSCYANRRALAF